jgi:hypothetical protein
MAQVCNKYCKNHKPQQEKGLEVFARIHYVKKPSDMFYFSDLNILKGAKTNRIRAR